jgi:hypothetical protein
MSPFALVLGSLLLFLLLLLVVIPYTIARVGGWAALAAEYRLNGRFTDRRWWFQDITLRGWCGYNGCASVGANAQGLYINTVFWVSHPPLFFPWSELSGARRELNLLGIRVGLVEFTPQRVPGVRITLRESLVQKIAASHVASMPQAPDGALCSPQHDAHAEVAE